MTFLKSISSRSLTLLILLLTDTTSAQTHFTWSDLRPDKSDLSSLTRIGISSNHQQLWLRQTSNNYTIEHFDADLRPAGSYPLVFDSLTRDAIPASLQCRVVRFRNDSIMCLVQYATQSKHLRFRLISFSPQGKLLSSAENVMECSSSVPNDFSLSSDSTVLTVVNITGKKAQKNLHIKTVNLATRQTLTEYSHEYFSSPPFSGENQFAIGDIQRDAHGLYLMEEIHWKTNQTVSDKRFILVDLTKKTQVDITPELGNVTIESASIAVTSAGFRVHGFYFENDLIPNPQEPSHLFTFEIDPERLGAKNLHTYPCSLEPVSDENSDYWTVDISSSIVRKDGGTFFFIERMVQDMRHLRLYTVPVGIASFGPSGELIFCKTLELHQAYHLGRYLPAYTTCKTYDSLQHQLYVLFNDDENNLSITNPPRVLKNMKAGIAVIATLDEHGTMRKYQLPMPKHGPVVCVTWSAPVSTNTLVVAGLEKNGFRLGQLNLNMTSGAPAINRVLPGPEREAPRRQTYEQSSDDAGYPKDAKRRLDGFVAISFGTLSNPLLSANQWLTNQGYPTHFDHSSYDGKFTMLIRSKKVTWGFEGGGSSFQDNKNYYETYGGFGFWKSGYIPSISSQVIFSFIAGWSNQEIAISQAALPYDPSSVGDFKFENFSYYLSPSVKILKSFATSSYSDERNGTLRHSWATGIDVGMRIYLGSEHWKYSDDNNGKFPGASTMPPLDRLMFYIHIPLGTLLEMF